MAKLALTLLIATVLAAASGAWAQIPAPGLPCADRDSMRLQLGAAYGEAPVAVGLRSDGDLLQVFASARTGTWTVVATAPDGLACVLAAGRGWEGGGARAPPPPGPRGGQGGGPECGEPEARSG